MRNHTTRSAGPVAGAGDQRLPLPALAALATAAFVTVLTEALPAGVLPAMGADLGVGESAMGQAVTIYAIGTAVAAIPLTAATAGWRRKRLLLTGVAGFAVANTVTAASPYFALSLAGRFVAGVAAGLVWALLAGYAGHLAPARLRGKAIAVVMTGIPLALSLGVPAGTFLGGFLGWRAAFSAITVIAAVLLAWIAVAVPDRPGRRHRDRHPILPTLRIAGVVPILFVTLVMVLAHTILYTYIATFLRRSGMGGSVDLVLLVFGAASMVSIWIVGAHIDRRPRLLIVAASVLFSVAAAVLAVRGADPALVYPAVTLWGLGFGGAPTLLQTAVAVAAGQAADTAQAMLVTLWNAAMAAGGVAGAVLLGLLGPGSFPWSVLALLVPVLAVVIGARTGGFPAVRRGAPR
ncbi:MULTISPECIES: MFS transporter [Streptosporangium]|uniref:MFS transporter n=1 Tax=Streptosporangium jomthongense TaxID=1193683 RepID=A0ABV8EXC4_9ACTN